MAAPLLRLISSVNKSGSEIFSNRMLSIYTLNGTLIASAVKPIFAE